jgi:hypothetical protein
MMTRAERIEYEILDCALNRTSAPEGWPTSLELFLMQLCELFPDIRARELIEACKRLAVQGALTLRKKEPGRGVLYHAYRGEHDDEAFFHNNCSELRFQQASMSWAHFKSLAALIEPPVTFKRFQKRPPVSACETGCRGKQRSGAPAQPGTLDLGPQRRSD